MEVIVLNSDFSPIAKISYKKAFKLIHKKKAEVIKYSEKVIKTIDLVFKLPLIIRLMRYIRNIYKSAVPYKSINVYIRDDFECVYCNEKLSKDDCTIDHVIPKSRGGIKSWENSVTACRKCNVKKGNRTPEEAKMFFKHGKKIYKPTINEFMTMKLKYENGINDLMNEIFSYSN